MGCILISSDWREGRCWQRLEDRWWWVVGLRTGRIGGLGCGPDLVLAVMKEKQTDLTVTNEPSPLPQLPVLFLSNSFPHPQSLPCSPTIFFLSALNPYLLHFHLPSSFSASVSPVLHFLLYFCSSSLLCSFTDLPPTITFPCFLFLLWWLRGFRGFFFLPLKRSCCILLHLSWLCSPFNR